MRIADFLTEHEVSFETVVHPPAFTAQRRAHFLHVPGQQVAKGVLLRGPRGHFLAVLPATHQVDTDGLAAVLEGPVRLGGDREIADVFRDCEWGVVSPFGSLYGLPTLLEAAIAPDTFLLFEADLHSRAVRVRCADFERLERPRRVRFARR